jgi:hypothetical protein
MAAAKLLRSAQDGDLAAHTPANVSHLQGPGTATGTAAQCTVALIVHIQHVRVRVFLGVRVPLCRHACPALFWSSQATCARLCKHGLGAPLPPFPCAPRTATTYNCALRMYEAKKPWLDLTQTNARGQQPGARAVGRSRNRAAVLPKSAARGRSPRPSGAHQDNCAINDVPWGPIRACLPSDE